MKTPLDEESCENWPSCPIRLASVHNSYANLINFAQIYARLHSFYCGFEPLTAQIDDFEAEDEIISTSLVELRGSRLKRCGPLSICFDDVKYVIKNLPLESKLSSVQLETLNKSGKSFWLLEVQGFTCLCVT